MNRKCLLDLCGPVINWLSRYALLPALIFISLAGLSIGAILVIKPKLAIEIQIRFYALINWKMEPVSWPKEILNTRIMGWLLAIFSLSALILAINKTALFP